MKVIPRSVSFTPIPLLTPCNPSPDGHEVEDVGHSRAVAQEAADADLEHNGDHQDLVPAGGTGWDRLRLPGSGQRQAISNWGPEGNQGTGSEEGRCRQQQGDVPNIFNSSMAHTSATVGAGPVSITPLVNEMWRGQLRGTWWELLASC